MGIARLKSFVVVGLKFTIVRCQDIAAASAISKISDLRAPCKDIRGFKISLLRNCQ
jgi:hypothetical protein